MRERGREPNVLPTLQVSKLQMEIDAEVGRQLQMTQDIQADQHRPQQRVGNQQRQQRQLQQQQQQQQQQPREERQRRWRTSTMSRSEQRMHMLAVLMLHYCAGIQHCNETAQSADDPEPEPKKESKKESKPPKEA